MMKKIIYIRTSTLEQLPELQLNDISTISPNDCEILKEQISAWCENIRRPVFDDILKLIKKHQISDLYVWDLDRVYRNRKKLQEFFILCKHYNCKIHSYRQKWLEDINLIPKPFDEIVNDLLISIFGWIAEEESQKKSERIKLAVRKKDGKKTVSYKGNKWGRKSLPKQTVDKVLELHLQGLSLRKIAENVQKWDNGNSKNISKSVVHKIIIQKERKKQCL